MPSSVSTAGSTRIRPRWTAVRLISCGIAVTVGVAIVLVVALQRLGRAFDNIVEREMQNAALVHEIVHLDEVLTMSARMAAASGDPAWIDRYHHFEPKLTEAITASMQLAPDAYAMAATSECNAANDALVAMELRSFELVRSGQAAAAQELLQSPDYEHHKRIYAQGMDRTRAAIQRSVQENSRAVVATLSLAHRAALVCAALLSVGWLIVLLVVRRMAIDQARIEQDLLDARLSAEGAMRAKADFLAKMSHEIRTPLNGVVGMNELMLTTPLDPEQAQYADNIRASGRSLQAVIDDILDYSKIDAGRLDLEAIPFDLAAVIDDVAALVGQRAAANGVELLPWIDQDVPHWLVGDPNRIAQVLLNLAGNAAKFTLAGEIRITARLDAARSETASDLVALCIEVADTGIGIPADRLQSLFTAFEQVDASTTRRFGGTGLGLAISRGIVTRMGGSLSVTSRPGEGSTFRVQLALPLAPDQHADHEVGEPQAFAGLQVLAVDDHPGTLKLLLRHLAELGCQATAAGDGEQALALAMDRPEPFGAVLVDYRMPNMDGATLATRLRELPRYRHVPIILFSADPRGATAVGDGIDARLLKPMRVRELERTLLRLLRPDPDAAAAARAPGRQAEQVAMLGLRILVAEDNLVNQRLMRAILGKVRVEAEIVPDGRAALDAFQRQRPDLILMDCQMPVLDGYAATRRIRELEAGSDRRIPIIAVTAHALPDELERCLASGFDACVTKPFRPEELFEEILRQVAAATH
ncbi:MAG: response regulator [Planctomycetes bacterium]|nr:response regulator [Planctomycetota bacterium]